MDTDRQSIKGRSDRLYSKPLFSTLLFGSVAAVSSLGYYGAYKHGRWNYYFKNKPKMLGSVLAGVVLFTFLNNLYSVDIKTLHAAPNEHVDLKTMRKDLVSLGMIKDKSSKPQ